MFFRGMFENDLNDETNADTSEIDTARPLGISKLEFKKKCKKYIKRFTI